MINFSFAAVLKTAAFLSFVALAFAALVDLATMGETRRIKLLSRSGLSQRAIASRLSVSRYRVQSALSAQTLR